MKHLQNGSFLDWFLIVWRVTTLRGGNVFWLARLYLRLLMRKMVNAISLKPWKGLKGMNPIRFIRRQTYKIIATATIHPGKWEFSKSPFTEECKDDDQYWCRIKDPAASLVYQNGDAAEEDQARPRILVLHFEHFAGLNLQTECNNPGNIGPPLYTGRDWRYKQWCYRRC
jgi:hypothetical protein